MKNRPQPREDTARFRGVQEVRLTYDDGMDVIEVDRGRKGSETGRVRIRPRTADPKYVNFPDVYPATMRTTLDHNDKVVESEGEYHLGNTYRANANHEATFSLLCPSALKIHIGIRLGLAMTQAPEEANKAVVRRHLEAMNDRDREAFVECFDRESRPHGMDFEEFVDVEFSFFDAFPDLQYPLHEVIADGDLVAFRWTFEGTHTGQGGPEPLGSVEPTHEEVAVSGINIARIEDDKIVEYTAEWDVLELLETLGVVDVST